MAMQAVQLQWRLPTGSAGDLRLHLALFGTVHYEALLLGAEVIDDTGSSICPSSIHTAADQDVIWEYYGHKRDLRKLAGVVTLASLDPTMACT